MKRLIVMRHAKSSWAEPGMQDHARPLNDRGRQDAPKVAQQLTNIGWQPNIIISSDSTRTRETLGLMALEFSDDVRLVFESDLYHAGVREVVAHVCNVPNDVTTVMVLGHNPGWEYVVEHLSGEEVIMKTATAALLDFDVDDWNDAIRCPGSWRLVDVIYPRDL
ncbi:MAG: histidine phosphatase family protein [Planctomycetales bacterium]|nr:histidine phosphatase family protein [Planctomycetales bacterium]